MQASHSGITQGAPATLSTPTLQALLLLHTWGLSLEPLPTMWVFMYAGRRGARLGVKEDARVPSRSSSAHSLPWEGSAQKQKT